MNSEEENQVQEQETRQTTPGYSGAFILILLGILFLLSNFGVLPWSVWQVVLRFWPVVLILIGLEVVVGGTWLGNFIFGLIGLMFFAGLIYFGIWIFNHQPQLNLNQRFNKWSAQLKSVVWQRDVITKELAASGDDFTGVEKRTVSLDFGVGKINLEETEEDDYLKISTSYYENLTEPKFETDLDEGELEIYYLNRLQSYQLGIKERSDFDQKVYFGRPETETDLKVKVGAGSMQADFEELNLNDVDWRIGAGSAEISFEETALPSGEFTVDVGAGSLVLNLPEDTGLQINYDIGLGTLEVDGENLRGEGEFTSENYLTAVNKVKMTVDLGLGSLEINF